MKLSEYKNEIEKRLNLPISYGKLASILGISRQYISKIKDDELDLKKLNKLNTHFNILSTEAEDFLKVPVKGEVYASMGHGVTVYNEAQTGVYEISRKLAYDIGVAHGHVDMIFASGNSMTPTIEGGDSLLIDITKKDIYDGRIYCVRIEGQLYAKRLQKIPPNKVIVISDNTQYKSFEIDFSKNIDFDFEVIGEVRWWGRIAK